MTPALKRLESEFTGSAQGLKATCQMAHRECKFTEHSIDILGECGMNGKLTYTCYTAFEVLSSHFAPFSLSPRADGKLLQDRRHLETIKNSFNYFLSL